VQPEDLLAYWLDDVGPKGWYGGGEDLDRAIRARFSSAWDQARDGAFGLWLTSPAGALAYVILTDQLPRNMFRGTAQAFATDPNARAAARVALGRDWDLAISLPARQFFYMPLEHAENLVDQDRAVELFAARMPEDAEMGLHARAHRAVIRRFGRFPGRNAALGRADTPEEAAWLAEGGYAAEVNRLRAGPAGETWRSG
jgi:uncharacterized protein (DUF924 family)